VIWLCVYLAVCTSYLFVIWRTPWMLLRPSFWVGCVFLAFICPAAALLPDAWRYEGTWFALGDYPHIGRLRLATLLFPVGLLIGGAVTAPFSRMARQLYLICTARRLAVPVVTDATQSRWRKRLSWAMAGIALLVSIVSVVMYLRHVPLTSTGLYAIIFDPSRSDVAREESLTNVGSALIRYSYSWHAAVFAPLLVVFLRLWASRRKLRKVVAYAIGMPLVVLSAMLPGNRSALATMIAVFAISYLLTSGVKSVIKIIAVTVLGVMSVIAITSIAREGRWDEISPALVVQYVVEKGSMRLFAGPFFTGVVTNAYVDAYGLTVGASIRPLAILQGVDYLQLPPIVGEMYVGPGASMNTSFLFDFQAAFGLEFGCLIALFTAMCLDCLLFAYRSLSFLPLVVLLSVQLTTLFALFSSALLVSLVSHGIIVPALLAFLLKTLSHRPSFARVSTQ
jgi:hypothetical protein